MATTTATDYKLKEITLRNKIIYLFKPANTDA